VRLTYADYSVDQLYQFLSAYTLTRDIGSQYMPNGDLPTLAGAGALRSCAEDMLTFVEAAMARNRRRWRRHSR
jgi:hypothetical protein